LKHLVVLLVAVGAGGWVSAGFAAMGMTLPAYIGAMTVAAVLRNVDDVAGTIGISQRTIDDLGSVALSIFLVMALMTLRLWQLAGAVVPLLIILTAQVALVALLLFVVPGDGAALRRHRDGWRLRGSCSARGQRRGQHGRARRRSTVRRRGLAVVPLVGVRHHGFINATNLYRLVGPTGPGWASARPPAAKKGY
jgi:ESS family glutamate:Na+ symporter